MSRGEFLSHVASQSNGCMLWTGTRNNRGYGTLSVGRHRHMAHRYAFELANGPIPTGLQVLHSCDVKQCVNPDHLHLGTHMDNMNECYARIGKNRAFGCRNGQAKLNPLKVEVMRALRLSGQTFRSIAADFGVDASTVRRACAGKHWAEA